MSELTKEFERIIEDTSGGTHNSQDWWDVDVCGTETIIEGLCRRLERAALSAKPKLPRVSPEALVEGEMYMAKYTHGDPVLVRYVGGKPTGMDHYRGWFLRIGEEVETCHAASTIYFGPLPEFDLEGEEILPISRN